MPIELREHPDGGKLSLSVWRAGEAKAMGSIWEDVRGTPILNLPWPTAIETVAEILAAFQLWAGRKAAERNQGNERTGSSSLFQGEA
jgi:hypothetical protein